MRPWTDRRLFWIFTTLLVAVVLFNPKPRWEDGDEAQYVALGKSLATGHGYVQVNHPEPMPETLRPPLYPWCLSLVMRLMPTESLWPLTLFSVFCYIVFGVAFYVWIRGETGDASWYWPAAFIGVSSVLMLGFAWRILTESMFLAVLALTVLASARAERSGAFGTACVTGILAGLCFLIRPPAICLAPAGALAFLLRRRWPQLIGYCASWAVVAAPWLVRTSVMTGHMLEHTSQYGGPKAGFLATLFGNIHQSLWHYTVDAIPGMLFYSLFNERCLLCHLHLAALGTPIKLLLLATMVAGMIVRWRKWGLVDFFSGAYLLLVASYNQPDYAEMGQFLFQDRYILPLLPFAAFYLAEGLRALPVPRLPRLLLAAAFIYCLAAAAGSAFVRTKQEMAVFGREPWDSTRYGAGEDDAAWNQYLEAGSWIRDHAPAGAVALCRKPEHIYLRSAVHALRYDGGDTWGGDAWGVVGRWRDRAGVYIIEDAFSPAGGYGRNRVQILEPMMAEHRSDLELVFEMPSPTTRVWRVLTRAEVREPKTP